MSGDNNADFLQSAGVLKQTMVRLQLGPGSLNFAEKFVEPHLAAYRLIDQAAESHEPILIAGKRSSAVLISEDDWKAIQETMHLLSVPGMRKSIRDAMAEPLAKSAKELNW